MKIINLFNIIKSKQNKLKSRISFKENKFHRRYSRKQTFQGEIRVIPLLKPPSKCRKSSNLQNYLEKKETQTKICWDNKTIEEQLVDRKLHPRNKKEEKKDLYPKGDKEDLYQELINKLNEFNPTEDLINKVKEILEKCKKNEKFFDINELIKKSDNNELVEFLKFYNNKLENLSDERRICLQNTLINKFLKELEKSNEVQNMIN